MTQVTAEMIREAEAHMPFGLKTPTARWEWMAEYLTQTLSNPDQLCPCCNVTRSGDIMDHLPSPDIWDAKQRLKTIDTARPVKLEDL